MLRKNKTFLIFLFLVFSPTTTHKKQNQNTTGIFFILPCIDTYARVDLRTRTYDVPPQEVSDCQLQHYNNNFLFHMKTFLFFCFNLLIIYSNGSVNFMFVLTFVFLFVGFDKRQCYSECGCGCVLSCE